jgi:hypothetical protein
MISNGPPCSKTALTDLNLDMGLEFYLEPCPGKPTVAIYIMTAYRIYNAYTIRIF